MTRPRVLLLQPPFFRLDAPSLSLAMLEAALLRAGMRCEVEHLNLELGARIGKELYAWVAGRAPRQLLLGDLVFAPILHRSELDLDRVRALAAGLELRRDERVPGSVLDQLPALVQAAGALLEETVARLPWQDYDLVGIATFFNLLPALALARRIKEVSGTPLILGGCNCEGELGESLHRSFPFLDLVCPGEGEALIVELAETLQRRATVEGIAGLIWRDAAGATRCNPRTPEADKLPAKRDRYPLDRLPVPRHDGWLEQARRLGVLAPEELQLPIETSRGCLHGQKRPCVFCGLNGERIRFRRKSPSRVLEELRLLISHGVPVLHCVDNILDRALLRTVLPVLAGWNPGCQLFWEVRPEFDRSEMELLARSGVVWLQAGIESLSTGVLERMGKGTTALGNLRFLRHAAELGIGASWSVLFGLPDEDPADYGAIAALMPALAHLQPPRLFQQIRVDRFSPLFVDRKGLSRVVPAPAYNEVFPFDPETVARLAYFFEYDYEVPRDPYQYTAGCAAAIEDWRSGVGERALIRFRAGNSLQVIDTRPLAVERCTVLRGLEQEVYLAAEEGATIEEIVRSTGAPAGAVRERVAWLLERSFAVELDGQLLSLAVPVDAWVPRGVPAVIVAEALREAYCQRMLSLHRGYQARESDRAGVPIAEPRS